jgi:hypothetical protein
MNNIIVEIPPPITVISEAKPLDGTPNPFHKLPNCSEMVNGRSIESLTAEFDNDRPGVIEFLIGMDWIIYNHARGFYQLTSFGESKVNTSKLIV